MHTDIGHALAWSEVELAPETSGIYAWYSRIAIGTADINHTIGLIEAAKQRNEQNAQREVEAALDRLVFNAFRETPYKVSLRGPLKPKFEGYALHEPSRSHNLVERIAADPSRFRVIAEILKLAAPWFTAPLYIGMAANLRTRLRQHKNRIIELRDTWKGAPQDEADDSGFANQVVARGFDPTTLFVHIAEVKVASSEHNDIENILNRINYPIFGRN